MERWKNEQTRSTLTIDGIPVAEAVQVEGGWVGRSLVNQQWCSEAPRGTRSMAITDIFEHKKDLLALVGR
jgi:hypothetical protein